MKQVSNKNKRIFNTQFIYSYRIQKLHFILTTVNFDDDENK